MKTLPPDPTSAMVDGPARTIIMWCGANDRRGTAGLIQHLKAAGAWRNWMGELLKEEHGTHHPTKGLLLCLLWRAMYEEAPAEPEMPEQEDVQVEDVTCWVGGEPYTGTPWAVTTAEHGPIAFFSEEKDACNFQRWMLLHKEEMPK